MSYNYQYQQSDQTYQYGSVYGSNASATTGGGYQLGANSGYSPVSYGPPGSQGGGSIGGTIGQQGLQNSQYSVGYGGQQASDPNYGASYSGSATAAAGADAYQRLAAAQAALAQAPPSMASGYPGGQPVYYANGLPTSSPPAYGSLQSPSSLYSSGTASSDYSYGAGYSGGLRSAPGTMAGYAPYPTAESSPQLHQSPYDSTYPTSGDTVSSTTAALGSVAGMPVPLGNVPGTGAEGDQGNCSMM